MSEKQSPLQVIKNAYNNVLKFELDDQIAPEIFVATLTALFCTRLNECVWIYFIAPAGSGKTLTVETVIGYRKCVLLTTPTENSFMSGYESDDGKDPSLLAILNGKVLIWKDFTALINGPPRTTAKIMGEMRDSFDQHSSKANGMTGIKDYICRYGQIACVTNKIDAFTDKNQQLGERFLSFRMNRIKRTHTERVKNLGSIVKSMANKTEWKENLRKLVQKELDRINDRAKKHPVPTIPAGALQKVMVMADLLALARTVPEKETAQDPELATRLVQQLINIGLGHCIADFRDEWDDSDTAVVQRIFVDSLKAVRARLLRYMYLQGPHRPAMTLEQMRQKSDTGKDEIKYIKSQYMYSGILVGELQSEISETWYRLSADVYKSLREIGVFDKKTKGK